MAVGMMELLVVRSQILCSFILWMRYGPSHFGSSFADQLASVILRYSNTLSPMFSLIVETFLFWLFRCLSCAFVMKSAASLLILCNLMMSRAMWAQTLSSWDPLS